MLENDGRTKPKNESNRIVLSEQKDNTCWPKSSKWSKATPTKQKKIINTTGMLI